MRRTRRCHSASEVRRQSCLRLASRVTFTQPRQRSPAPLAEPTGPLSTSGVTTRLLSRRGPLDTRRMRPGNRNDVILQVPISDLGQRNSAHLVPSRGGHCHAYGQGQGAERNAQYWSACRIVDAALVLDVAKLDEYGIHLQPCSAAGCNHCRCIDATPLYCTGQKEGS
jgi:hypothetical protein